LGPSFSNAYLNWLPHKSIWYCLGSKQSPSWGVDDRKRSTVDMDVYALARILPRMSGGELGRPRAQLTTGKEHRDDR
jgi:hypothetical protein